MKTRERSRFEGGWHWKVSVLVVSALVVGSVALSSATAGATKRASGPSGSVTVGYDFATNGGMNFDPRSSATGLNGYLQHMVEGALFWWNQDGSLRPDLATGYSVVSPTVVEVDIRPNLKFQDGSALTATEVKASWERNQSSVLTNMPSVARYAATFNGGGLQSIEVVSPTKLRFTLVGPQAGGLVMAFPQMVGVVVNPKQFDDPNLKNAPIGAGPYKIVSYSPGQTLKLTASDTYWDAKNTRIKDVTVSHQDGTTASGSTQGINRVTTGEFDYFNAFNSDTASVLASAKGNIKAVTNPSDTQFTWFLLCKNPWKSITADQVAGLADVNVRTAMNLMIDRDGLNKTLYAGKSEPMTQNWRKDSPFYDKKAATAFTYNPTKAKQFMAKSAFPNGFEFTVVVNSTPTADRIAQYLQQQWAQLGIKLNILTSLNIAADWFAQLKGPAAETNFIGVQINKLIQTYDSTDGTNRACGYSGQQSYIDTMKATSPDALKSLKATWQASAEKVATDQSQIMLVWGMNQALYNGSKIAKVAITLDGLGREQFDPTRSAPK